MTTNFQFAQAPNRKGNQSKNTPTGTGGATGVTGPSHGMAGPKGQQGAPKAGGSITGRHQPVALSKPKHEYCGKIENDGYMSKSVKNYGG